MTKDEATEIIDNSIARFKASQPKSVDAAKLTLQSRIPYKLLGARELLFVRSTDIADAAWMLYKDKRVVPSFVLMRSCVETCCVAHYLNKKSTAFLHTKDVDAYDEILKKILGGSREKDNHPSVLSHF